ncbi:hypothetical protein ACFWPU_01035 [Streptomyces sp. NPDC058471]|uniref:hypothetical protein n=1 Tax=Streptomyces sp. NPDC058471 TaxID=3346516 RepID=UPI003667A531
MGNANLAISTVADGSEVGSTKINYMLVDSGTSARPNAAVHRVEVTLKDPSAVLLIKIGRTENTDSGGSGNTEFARANLSTRAKAYLTSFTDGDDDLDIMLGRYYFSGGQPFVLDFPEPIEALRDWQSSTDSAFAITLKRVDTSTAVGFTLNVWHEEY